MPTYEYECPDCKHAFEEYQSITAKPIKVCPECGKRRVVRLIGTGSGVIFKGSGFYETDYRSANYKKGAKAEKDASSSSTDKSGSKGEAGKKSSTSKSTDSGSSTSSGSDGKS